jgi:urease accessory protein
MAAATNREVIDRSPPIQTSIRRDNFVETVGRCGDLILSFEQRRGLTELSSVHCRSPWHFMPPMALDGGRCAYTMLVNPSGGLVGGDRLSLSASIGPGGQVLFSTPSANRIYRTAGPEAVQDVVIGLGPEARVEWLPDVTIPFAGSRFRQSIDVSLGPGASVLLWDALACGRVASGERWAFAEYGNQIRIGMAGGGEVLERIALSPRSTGVGLVEPWNYVAALFLVADGVGSAVWDDLHSDFEAWIDETSPDGEWLAAVSELPIPGLVVRLLARTAHSLHAAYERAWSLIRSRLWRSACPSLRRY